jgi:uncharacterized protein
VKRLGLLACGAVLFGCTAAHAAYPTRPEGLVLDQADVLPVADEAALNYRLARYKETSGNTIAVVTLNSLEDRTIEDYGAGLFQQWRVGDPTTQRGILVLLAPSEGQTWIAIGCGFGGALTDTFLEEIMQKTMIPQYKQHRFEEGTLAAVDALINRLATARVSDKSSDTRTCKTVLRSVP